MVAMMISQDEINSLPEDPNERFVGVEAICRKRLYGEIEGEEEWSSIMDARLRYMGAVLAAGKYLNVEPFASLVLPTRQKFQSDDYDNFIQELEYYVVQLMLRNSENASQTTVLLQGETRQRLHTLLAHLRTQLLKLDLPPSRVEKLRSKLAEFEKELDAPRMRIIVWAGAALVVTGILADVGGAATTVLQLWHEIEEAVGIAKEAQDEEAVARIPAAPEQKRIEGPQRPKQLTTGDFDDEIPF
jgi:hypothetical protein